MGPTNPEYLRGQWLQLIAAKGNLYLTDTMQSDKAYFGNAVVRRKSTAAYHTNLVVASLTDAGTEGRCNWVRSFDGPANEQPTGLGLAAGRLYIAGLLGGKYYGDGFTQLSGFLAALPLLPAAATTRPEPQQAGRASLRSKTRSPATKSK